MVQLVLKQSEQIDRWDEDAEPLHYAEAWATLALAWFAERHVDVAVVEVGAGGRFDSTNAVDPVVSVITSVGLDHVVSLGPTIADIAWHKAGVIKSGSTTVVGPLPADARAVVTAVAEAVGSQLIDSSECQVNCESRADTAAFQRQNACTAYTVISSLRERGFAIPESAVVEGLANARLPGRFERMPDEQPTVWLDGAHNADKMGALAAELNRRQGDAPLPVAVLGVLGAKDASAMISRLNGIVSTVVATEPQVIGKRALPASSLAQLVSESGFEGKIICESHVDSALNTARDLAVSQGTEVFVTGSLYLVGQVRRHWYPNDEIVIAQSPWPSAARGSNLGVDRALGSLVGDKTNH
jgi:dihydrofolate synthase/folylpolyglutamate synthase